MYATVEQWMTIQHVTSRQALAAVLSSKSPCEDKIVKEAFLNCWPIPLFCAVLLCFFSALLIFCILQPHKRSDPRNLVPPLKVVSPGTPYFGSECDIELVGQLSLCELQTR